MASMIRQNYSEKCEVSKTNYNLKVSFKMMPDLVKVHSIQKCITNSIITLQARINMHISVELKASYVYLAMGSYFERDDVALHGFAKFFKKASGEERDQGTKFMEYQVRQFAIRMNL